MELSHNHTERYSRTIGTPILTIWVAVAVLHHYVIPIGGNAQMILFALSILFAGIPHGALDHLVEEKSFTLRNRKFSFIRFLVTYVLKMAVFGLLWYFMPLVSLGVFLLFSAYHFGETDLAKLKPVRLISPLFNISYGLLILTCLLLSHLEEVIPILSQLPGNSINVWLQPLEEYKQLVLLISVALALITGLAYFSRSKNNPEQLVALILQLGFILIIINILPLILSFTFYFGWWHSLHSLENIRQHLSGNNSSLSWQTMMKKSIPFSLTAFGFMMALLIWAGITSNIPILLLGFFIGIAILTAPHLDIMSRMYRGSTDAS